MLALFAFTGDIEAGIVFAAIGLSTVAVVVPPVVAKFCPPLIAYTFPVVSFKTSLAIDLGGTSNCGSPPFKASWTMSSNFFSFRTTGTSSKFILTFFLNFPKSNITSLSLACSICTFKYIYIDKRRQVL